MADEPDLEDDIEEPDELSEDDLEDLGEDDLVEDDDEVALDDDEEEEDPAAVVVVTPAPAAEDEDEEEDDDLEPDDVEASLDQILKERLVVADDEEEDEDEVPETDERSDAVTKVLPKQPDEFVCQSCFLVKHPSQLADADRMFCRDCV
ncbi:MAG TPA: DUF4193 family protein [Acidimicrobiales bacterium]|nr:DUF4193 family protein [Acidimicrobiales bacterium]